MKETKTEKILHYLQENKTLTSIQAIEMFGSTRLASIIFNLRRHGEPIETVMVDGNDRYGNNIRFARYTYKGD